ncbi:CMP-N-acetylneuraminate-beta-galactosamide-alpha-2,3-sialyltransferase 1-like [Eucyclogobius newberryi]|uniref:CMP-N-acetylneuraminate-beta-galactosamide- alpha-2,3-sialyltransferase 1-like n=1 Tax=Eucyclogobius newberryi TaxID=166745 RepID=UPI003B59B404
MGLAKYLGATRMLTPGHTGGRPEGGSGKRPATIFYVAGGPPKSTRGTPGKARPQTSCAYCNDRSHHLSRCPSLATLSQAQLTEWIKANKRCWRCARSHRAAQCTLKKCCNLCQGRHLQVLHQVNIKSPTMPATATPPASEGKPASAPHRIYRDCPSRSRRVLLKVVPVTLYHEGKTLKTHAVLDDGSERKKKIQSGYPDLNVFKSTVQKIFEIIPVNPPVVEPSPHRCLTCAVVGNSGNLLRSHYGKLIDQYNSVFRINRGKTEGFEEDVGSRTTHRVMYPESASNLDNSTHMVLFTFKGKDLEWLVNEFRTSAPGKGKPIANKNMVMVVHPAFMQYVHKSWLQSKGDYPSTGFMTVILALHLCDEVNVFGFGADSNGNWTHYWTKLYQILRTGPHPGSVEYHMIEELARKGKVVLYKGI